MSFKSRETGTGLQTAGVKTSFKWSLLALSVNALFNPLAALAASSTATTTTTAATSQDLVVDASVAGSDDSDKKDYTEQVTRAGTKLLLAPRDVPQSVTVVTQQRMKDQQLQTVGDVLTNTTGISASLYDSERSSYYSRGYEITSYSYDDIPTSVSDTWNLGDAAEDSAIYDKIEIVRGANGLMSGSGSPGASVNMVRKRADSKTFTGDLYASYGSWNNQRYVADLSGPLNSTGSVRGRVVAGYQDQDSWLDRYHKRKEFLYGVVDADLTDSTTLSLGYDFQESQTANPTWGGLPIWYSNGAPTHFARSTNPSADWTHYDLSSHKVFVNLDQKFDNGWVFRLNATHAQATVNDKLIYLEDFADAQTGLGLSAFGSKDQGKRNLDSVDTFTSGPIELFGRQHQLLAGLSFSRQHNRYYSSDGDFGDTTMPDINNWNGDVAEPSWGDWYLDSDDIVRQKSMYTAARFSLADPLSLIIGARYTQWSTHGSSGNVTKYNTTPYGGLVYDINDTWSAYASYTSIFQPQTYRDANGHYLSPVTGKNYETGLKSDWYNGKLTATLAVFRLEQSNVAQALDGVFVNNSSEQAYATANGTVSKGAEFELNGAVTDNLKMTFGISRYVARDNTGARLNSDMPETEIKLFTSYNLPMLPELTVGGGVNWQNRVYKDATYVDGSTKRYYQGSYPLVNLFARYDVTKQLSVQANLQNLFDRGYYTSMDDDLVYGQPFNYSVSLSYHF
ncbi:ferric-rhodotorulic acid/ferric-coprogen receptor FhuE [Pantoea sp. A4]|uniref:ferric-rhodotorulic acid/ferric-coprogen receptor FhuE n=1 Tax=Pantoea sp. A4 TaxID=1225184 RepID=UPI0003717B3C|nr:ferric-rhodotorulic acid/ferric-coprogen receptor FhuE [Pantoea sp. A4]